MNLAIKKTSISQQVVDYVLDLISKGDLKPGDQLPSEREFAESLGISRVPLREGISALAAIGIVEKRQGGGNYIGSFSMNTLKSILKIYTILDNTLLDDFFEARSLVEGAAAKLAARNANHRDIDIMRNEVELMEKSIPAYINGDKRLKDMLEMDDKFHLECAAASHNELYIQFVHIVHNMGTDMKLYEKKYGREPEKYYESVKYHRSIIDAIEDKDEASAEKIMYEHIENVRRNSSMSEEE